VKDRIRSLFKLNDPPHRLALAFAVGVFIAFSPTIGLHTLSVFALAWVFRLNTIVMFTAAFINNPWTIVPMYGFCLWFGIRITGSDIPTPDIPWGDMGLSDLFLLLKPYLWPFVAGTLVVGIVAAALSYGLFYWALVRYRKTSAA
jgi:uncharacterized protein (DUF2062 family)